jgi:hypothetical protein
MDSASFEEFCSQFVMQLPVLNEQPNCFCHAEMLQEHSSQAGFLLPAQRAKL